MDKKPSKIDNILGWIGTFFILLAYVLNSFGFLKAISYSYILLNLFGGIGVAYISYRYRNYQPALINIVWAIVAIIALIRLLMLI
jgi:hypothetical protein